MGKAHHLPIVRLHRAILYGDWPLSVMVNHCAPLRIHKGLRQSLLLESFRMYCGALSISDSAKRLKGVNSQL